MSRTTRNPARIAKYMPEKRCRDGRVRDGTRTRSAGSCQSHGGCPHCLSNRMHKHRRKEPLPEILEITINDY